MPVLDLSLPSPAQNLALDEALLEAAEADDNPSAYGLGLLRFWESSTYFVTLGYTNRASTEAHLEACAVMGVPILRRCSGGGTVLQGPGCLNYALIGSIPPGDALNVGDTNCLVMRRNRAAMETLLGAPVELAGHTDLAAAGLKFSGNAQRRKRRFFLFHGTLLLNFDLELVQTLLRPPSKQPDYRAGRTHSNFIRNLRLPAHAVKKALTEAWEAGELTTHWPRERVEDLVRTRYSQDSWNHKF